MKTSWTETTGKGPRKRPSVMEPTATLTRQRVTRFQSQCRLPRNKYCSFTTCLAKGQLHACRYEFTVDECIRDFATTEIHGLMSGLPNTHPETCQLLYRARS